MTDQDIILWLENMGMADVPRVGGKNASLGEMIQNLTAEGVRVPPGFATTADAYRAFLAANGIEAVIRDQIEAYRGGAKPLSAAGQAIRDAFLAGEMPAALGQALDRAYAELCRREGTRNLPVAVRSSATAEDLPEASFAGQQETFLNVRGAAALREACRRCYASLFTNRAIAYRENHDFDHLKVALSVGVQKMVRADLGGAGVMFSLDTETGFPNVVLITAAWGLGETVVQGEVDPDQHMVFKPLLDRADLVPIVQKARGAKAEKLVYGRGHDKTTRLVRTSRAERERFVLEDGEVLQLARWACAIERHYGRPMDMEWARDGREGELYIVQARPETVQARRQAAGLRHYTVRDKGRVLATGLSVGEGVASGKVCRLSSPAEIDRFPDQGILVTGATDPDWVPIMKRARAIVTDHGGRTSHAAIVSRELGLTAIVGAGDATRTLRDGQEVTVSCAEGDQGFVYEGIAEVEVEEIDLAEIPATRTQVMLNLADPAAALRWWRLPADGVGLARMEFIINTHIKVHPMALIDADRVTDAKARRAIAELTRGYADRRDFFVETLAYGIARIAAALHPKPVILRMSDFKTNEYADLLGGAGFEPKEENPMLGWRGASRYYSEGYAPGFALECAALRKVRAEIGLDNLVVMIPFCRTLEEADRVLAVMAENGLKRGEDGLEVYVMCEIPANVVLARRFAERFDGFSIGSNDLTQLVLGVDRDSEILASLFSEDDPAVKEMIASAIRAARAAGRKIGLCGQAPSNRPEFARFLVDAGIDSISVTPDSFLRVKQHVAEAERAAAAAGTEA